MKEGTARATTRPMRAWLAVVAIGCAAAPPRPVVVASPPRPVARSEPAGKPEGYVEMRAERVVGLGAGGAVLLVDQANHIAVPIFIGGTEATAIEGRLRGEPPIRPLTHDLLDQILLRVHAALVKVQVDAVRDDTFIGSIYLRIEGRIVKLDARPSDAIALALGSHVPIFVAQGVIDHAGLNWDDLQRQLANQPTDAG